LIPTRIFIATRSAQTLMSFLFHRCVPIVGSITEYDLEMNPLMEN
jgi:hypothetical protein